MTTRSAEGYRRLVRIKTIVKNMVVARQLPPGPQTDELRELVKPRKTGRPPKQVTP
jgi:hypothetical protein